MLIVDSHCHAGTSWFEPIESLLFQMDRNDVDKGVLIQHRGVYDNAYLLDCVRRFPGRFTVAAMVDPGPAGGDGRPRAMGRSGRGSRPPGSYRAVPRRRPAGYLAHGV